MRHGKLNETYPSAALISLWFGNLVPTKWFVTQPIEAIAISTIYARELALLCNNGITLQPYHYKYPPFLSSTTEPSVSSSGRANTSALSKTPTTGLAFAATTVLQDRGMLSTHSLSDQQPPAQ